MKFRWVTLALPALIAGAALASPVLSDATRLLAEAKIICERDGGRLWGSSICGPVLIVDWQDRAIIASTPDAGGKLVADGRVFRGVLSEDVIVANTPTEWSGTRWTQIVSPISDDPAARRVLIAHELFHRVQAELGLTRPEVANRHLDTLEGRYLLQLEWRALARALKAQGSKARRSAIADALAFRGERHRLFADAADQEAALEVNEGIAEYTGVKLGLETQKERIDFALRDLEAFGASPTFVRSFAYATGPAYGLLLDDADPKWRSKIKSLRFDELLTKALNIRPGEAEPIAARAKRYDDGALRVSEEQREASRLSRLGAYTSSLIDGPVLILPLKNSNYQFNPQTLVPLDGRGTVYPTMRLTDDWGSLEVEEGGALVDMERGRSTVSAVGASADGLKGDGWHLTLERGWEVHSGPRAGDLTVACASGCK